MYKLVILRMLKKSKANIFSSLKITTSPTSTKATVISVTPVKSPAEARKVTSTLTPTTRKLETTTSLRNKTPTG